MIQELGDVLGCRLFEFAEMFTVCAVEYLVAYGVGAVEAELMAPFVVSKCSSICLLVVSGVPMYEMCFD